MTNEELISVDKDENVTMVCVMFPSNSQCWFL